MKVEPKTTPQPLPTVDEEPEEGPQGSPPALLAVNQQPMAGSPESPDIEEERHVTNADAAASMEEDGQLQDSAIGGARLADERGVSPVEQPDGVLDDLDGQPLKGTDEESARRISDSHQPSGEQNMITPQAEGTTGQSRAAGARRTSTRIRTQTRCVT